nr:hypothetical protein [Tanacetum cinerariifolium]
MNMYPANKAYFEAEKEAIHLILTELEMKYTRLLMLAKQLRKCGKLSKGYKKPEWSRFVTIAKQQHKLDEVSYHKLFDILKHYQKEVNELRTKRLARNANPLALVATAQANQDPYYQTSKSHKSYAPSSKPSIPTKTHTTTRYKGKEIAKLITPPSESASEEDSNPKHAQRDKDMQKNLALIAKYFKKIYKPTNNNLRTSSNSRNKNVDTTPRYKNDNQSRLFRNQRTVNVAGARENECRKLKRVKDSAYHKEKMLLCKQAEKVETDDSNVFPDSPNMCDDDIQNDQNDVESDDERVVLANLIANLKLDVDENKKIQKQLKKTNTTLAQELKECKTTLVETSKTLGESNSVRDSCLVALQNKQTEFEKYKAFNDRTVDYDKLERKLNATLGQLPQKGIEIKEGLKTKAYEILVVKEKNDELIKQSLLTKSHYEGLVKQKTKNDSFIFVHELKQEMHADLKYVESLKKEIDELESDKAEFSNMYDMILQECVSNDVMCSYLLSLSDLDALAELQCLYPHKAKECVCLAQKLLKKIEYTVRNTNPRVSTSTGVNHKTNVSRPQHRSNQLKDKVVPNNSQVKLKKTQVEEHPRISSISNKIKSVTACNDSLNSKILNVNAVCATCKKCLVDSDHFACVTKMLNDVNARNKKPNVVPICIRKPKSHANKSVVIADKNKVATKSTTQKLKSYYRMLYEKTSKAWKWWIEQQCRSGYKRVPKTKMQWVPKAKNENVQKKLVLP